MNREARLVLEAVVVLMAPLLGASMSIGSSVKGASLALTIAVVGVAAFEVARWVVHFNARVRVPRHHRGVRATIRA